MSESEKLITGQEMAIIESLKALGWWQTNKTINIQATSCGDLRVCWNGSLLGYWTDSGWTQPLRTYLEVFPNV